MPVNYLNRLPLPNLKVYAATSVILLSVTVCYALSVTSDPNWKINATPTTHSDEAQTAASPVHPALPGGPGGVGPGGVLESGAGPDASHNESARDFGLHFVNMMYFMLQEPICMWAGINVAYLLLVLLGVVIQHTVFGALRAAEIQHIKDKFWNYVFYKFIFVFGVINVQYMDEVLLWCSWFSVLGFLHLIALLCKDRFEYLSSSPVNGGWAYAKLGALLAAVLAAAVAMLAVAAATGLPRGLDTFAFMATECVLVALCALHTALRLRPPSAAQYRLALACELAALAVEAAAHVHMLAFTSVLVSMASLVLIMQLRHVLRELRARLRRHRLYRWVLDHLDTNYPMASAAEVAAHSDNCAICWEGMESARKLPCGHLFHNGCLSEWLQQDPSCPTCRRALPAPVPARVSAPPRRHTAAAPPPPVNHFFHFDGSRYVSWLPSFSVEVSRVRSAAGIEGVQGGARQVHAMFPQHALADITADLARTRAVHLTVDNILEGRLPAPAAPDLAAPTAPHIQLESMELTGEVEEVGGEDGEEGQAGTSFPQESAQREVTLARRKRLLLQAARKRYMQRT